MGTVVGVLVGCLVIFILVEGLSSATLLGWDAAKKSRGFLGSRRHVDFDPELGWTNRPKTSIPDRYGPGLSINIDARGLRGTREFPDAPEGGQHRILCSGDSFTFGKGNDDAHTWCARLDQRRPDVEALNAGEEAYGLGQMYLKTKRLSKAGLRWNVNVFAFIADDIRRMNTTDFIGRGKPRVALRDGALTVLNSPVERASDAYLWFRANRRIFQGLRFLELGTRIQMKFADPASFGPPPSDEETAQTVGAILEAAAALSKAQGAEALFVFLPSGPDFDAAVARWRPLVKAQAAQRGLRYHDAVGSIWSLPSAEQTPFFDPVYRHFSEAGNQKMADEIWGALEAEGLLGAATSTGTSTAGVTAPAGR